MLMYISKALTLNTFSAISLESYIGLKKFSRNFKGYFKPNLYYRKSFNSCGYFGCKNLPKLHFLDESEFFGLYLV